MMRKNNSAYSFASTSRILFCTITIVGFFAQTADARSVALGLKNKLDTIKTDNDSELERDDEVSSIWDSKPIEIDHSNIQVLDKISGKVLKKAVRINEPAEFDKIEVTVKRCFKNAPEDSKEVYAFVEIKEYGKILFARWLFASSPSLNLFEHPQYDVRVEF